MQELRKLGFLATVVLFALSMAAAQTSIYVAQNATGADSGADCNNAHSAAWFNTASNWGTATTQIGPGDTVHLCGTFTGAAGSTMLTTQGSGVAGNPITILFEPGALLTAPYWGNDAGGMSCPCTGAVTLKHPYIILDGGSNGVIQNSANGSSLQYKHDSIGVVVNASNVEVRGLTIQQIYQNVVSLNETNGQYTADIRVTGNISNVNIHHNTLLQARAGIWWDARGNAFDIHDNTIQNHCWQIVIGGSGAPQIHNNDMSIWTDWSIASGAYHTDGIIAFGDSATTFTPQIYNNYFHGDLDPLNASTSNATGMVFCTYGTTGQGSACTIYNNVFVGAGHCTTNCAAIYFHGTNGIGTMGPHDVYNNTFVNFGQAHLFIENDPSISYTVRNNIFFGSGASWAVSLNGAPNSVLTKWDNNVGYNLRSGGYNSNTFGAWQSLGFDVNGFYADPKLDAQYHPQSGSAAIGIGANLTSVGLVPLDSDKAGLPRPTSLNWDSGAYLYSSQVASGPTAPTGLLAIVQ